MKTIYFKPAGQRPNTLGESAHGWIAVGDHFSREDGPPLLSQDCRTMEELREAAERLKRLIDEAVVDAESHLPSKKGISN